MLAYINDLNINQYSSAIDREYFAEGKLLSSKGRVKRS